MKWKFIVLGVIFVGFFFWEQKKTIKEKLIFCNVGQGDSALLITKQANILIDTGPNNGQVLKCLENNLPFWDKTVDIVLISHWDSDHSGGLADILKYYEVKNIFCADYESGTNEQKSCSKKLKFSDIVSVGSIEFEVLSSGQKLSEAEKIKVDDNENSVVGILSYKDKKILFTGDTSIEIEQRLVWREILNEKVDILKVSHHGSAAATSDLLLNKIIPEVAVISVGKNSFGHPTNETLKRLENHNVKVLRTDMDGEVTISF